MLENGRQSAFTDILSSGAKIIGLKDSAWDAKKAVLPFGLLALQRFGPALGQRSSTLKTLYSVFLVSA